MPPCPFCLFCRYTLFIPAYPVGVLSEMLLLYQALPYIQSRDMYSISMPNKMNMGFSYLRFSQVQYIFCPRVDLGIFRRQQRQGCQRRAGK